MSTGKGGGRGGRSKAQGWEEAGSEFYQESFPTDADGQVQKDPVPIATLLPSKQNRMGKTFIIFVIVFFFNHFAIHIATTRRVRNAQMDTKLSKKRSNTQNSTTRRGSQYHEVQVSMLPDLSGKPIHNYLFISHNKSMFSLCYV